jgi:translation initiation factor IF-1
MGADEAVRRGQGPDARRQKATVIELMPAAGYLVKLENEDLMVVHAAGATRTNFVRLRPGDKVLVEVSPHDRTRGRIVELLKG